MSSAIYVFANDGSCLEKRSGLVTPALTLAYQKKFGNNVLITEWVEDPFPDLHEKSYFTAEIEEGEVSDILLDIPATAYIHCDLSATKPDPGGGDPVESALFGLPAIRTNCAGGAVDATVEDVLTALISLRENQDPASAVLTTISGVFPITILPELGGGEARQLAVTVNAGRATVLYRALPGSPTGKYQLRQESLAPIPDGAGGVLMETKLVGDPVSFRIYETAEQA